MSEENLPTKTPARTEGAGAPKGTDAQTAYESRRPTWKTLGGAALRPPRTHVTFATSRLRLIANARAEPAARLPDQPASTRAK